MTLLSVNIDHVATLRQARQTNEPDPIQAAGICETAGAQGITIHLRGDRRHIQDRDLRLLRQTVTTKLNVEMAATDEMLKIATEIVPDQVTLVPELPNEVTTTGGLNCMQNSRIIAAAIQRLASADIPVSLFIDPVEQQIRRARELEARMIELNTAHYSNTTLMNRSSKAAAQALDEVREAAKLAESLDLQVLAGHGLTYRNVRAIAAIEPIEELNIGHNIISRAVLVGLDRAVRDMVALLSHVG